MKVIPSLNFDGFFCGFFKYQRQTSNVYITVTEGNLKQRSQCHHRKTYQSVIVNVCLWDFFFLSSFSGDGGVCVCVCGHNLYDENHIHFMLVPFFF